MRRGPGSERQGWSYEQFLGHLVECELSGRQTRRVERFLCESGLSREKTLSVFDMEVLPMKVRNEIPLLLEGSFAKKGENVLFFGLPGRGKTHLANALGCELVRRGFDNLKLTRADCRKLTTLP